MFEFFATFFAYEIKLIQNEFLKLGNFFIFEFLSAMWALRRFNSFLLEAVLAEEFIALIAGFEPIVHNFLTYWALQQFLGILVGYTVIK